MSSYRVVADGTEVAWYRDFERAGHGGVRARVNGRSEEIAGTNAYVEALEKAHDLTRYVFGKPAPKVKVLREDGTVAIEIKEA